MKNHSALALLACLLACLLAGAPPARAGKTVASLTYRNVAAPLAVGMARLSGPALAVWIDPTGPGGQVDTSAAGGDYLPNVGTATFTPPGPNAAGVVLWTLRIGVRDTALTFALTTTATVQ